MVIQEALKLAGGFDFPDIFPSLTFFHSIRREKPALEEIHCKVSIILQEIIKDHTPENDPSPVIVNVPLQPKSASPKLVSSSESTVPVFSTSAMVSTSLMQLMTMKQARLATGIFQKKKVPPIGPNSSLVPGHPNTTHDYEAVPSGVGPPNPSFSLILHIQMDSCSNLLVMDDDFANEDDFVTKADDNTSPKMMDVDSVTKMAEV
ncbi:hypothetical protein RJ640_012465 [Escallonia rubra]|uniref:Uncharacterized protein n=1 Tax=Escallonia rubra TaxID=112253 RepID=A0AA88R1I7_9ASTE|nr:hypothetical protein RJ640_012465 [Escallonia rubra]